MYIGYTAESVTNGQCQCNLLHIRRARQKPTIRGKPPTSPGISPKRVNESLFRYSMASRGSLVH